MKDKYDGRMELRLPRAVKTALETEARRNGLQLSEFIRMVLHKKLKARREDTK